MANTYTAPFAQFPRTATAMATAAAVDIHSGNPLNVYPLLTAGPDGAILTRLTALPTVTTTARWLALFLSSDGGVTKQLIDTVLMNAHTVAATTAIPVAVFGRYDGSTPLRLGAGDQLFVGIGVASTNPIVFRAEYSDY